MTGAGSNLCFCASMRTYSTVTSNVENYEVADQWLELGVLWTRDSDFWTETCTDPFSVPSKHEEVPKFPPGLLKGVSMTFAHVATIVKCIDYNSKMYFYRGTGCEPPTTDPPAFAPFLRSTRGLQIQS